MFRFGGVMCVLCFLASANSEDNLERKATTSSPSTFPPFRMYRVQMVWEKALKKYPDMDSSKMKQLFSELKFQDEREMTLKKLKSMPGGHASKKSGEEVREKYNDILNRFGLGGKLEQFVEQSLDEDAMDIKTLLKDKKLSKLWDKAQKMGMKESQLASLQEELVLHQERLELYHHFDDLLLKSSNDSTENDDNLLPLPDDATNGGLEHNEITINQSPDDLTSSFSASKFSLSSRNDLQSFGETLKSEFERLHRLATNYHGGDSHATSLSHPRVQALTQMSMGADLTSDELDDIKNELNRLELKLSKVDFITAELDLLKTHADQMKEKEIVHSDEIDERMRVGMKSRTQLEKELKKHSKHIDDMENSVKRRIAARYIHKTTDEL